MYEGLRLFGYGKIGRCERSFSVSYYPGSRWNNVFCSVSMTPKKYL